MWGKRGGGGGWWMLGKIWCHVGTGKPPDNFGLQCNHVAGSPPGGFYTPMLPKLWEHSEGSAQFSKQGPPTETDCSRINAAESAARQGLLQYFDTCSNYKWLHNLLYLQFINLIKPVRKLTNWLPDFTLHNCFYFFVTSEQSILTHTCAQKIVVSKLLFWVDVRYVNLPPGGV